MAKYKKKPVVIEAIKYDGFNSNEIKSFVGEKCEIKQFPGIYPKSEIILIHTLEGDMKVNVGDFIVKGVQGEFYPCKPDIFAETYEPAD